MTRHKLFCNEFEVRPSPVFIAMMVYSNGDGGWEGILYRYKQYVSGMMSCQFPNMQIRETAQMLINNHLKEADDAAAKHGKLTFSLILTEE